MRPVVRYAPSAQKISETAQYTFNMKRDTFLADEDVVRFDGKNIACIAPYFNDPDPLLIRDGNQVRLRHDSLAISAASDGSNLGAWQSD